jgi:hypothetical protein
MGCKAHGDKPIAASPRGWKKHMTRQHGGYTQEQLAAALGAVAPDSEVGRDLFLSEADGVTDSPSNRDGDTGEEQGEGKISSPEKIKEIKTDAAARKLSAKFNKFQKKITEQLTKALSSAVEEKGSEWAMDEGDQEMFKESLENCFEVLDVEFNIAPITAQLTNPLWVLLMPLLALALIFVPKAIKNLPKEKEENKP